MAENLAAALIRFHKEVGPILKLSNAQYGKYADLHTVLDTITPTLCVCDLCVVQSFTPDGGLSTQLHHISGETLESVTPLITGASKNALHGWGAAVTYQRRYALLALLNLAAGLDDDDGGASKPDPVSTDDDFF